MHVFVYEWITGGGLVDQPGRLPATLLAEGAAMSTAVATDFLALDDCRVTRLADPRMHQPLRDGERIVEVHSEAERRDEFATAAAEADFTLLIAPEFDRILSRTFRDAAVVGARLLGGSSELIRLASDKTRTCERLAAAGVPTPTGVIVEADAENLPRDFTYPGVLKPVDGAGSQHTYLVEDARDQPPPYPWPRRLERFCPGRAASVAALCGPAGHVILPPCWQRQSGEGRFTYLGGAIIEDPDLAARAVDLACRALAVLPAAIGYVGFDVVLGDCPAGGDDVVVEVNPRLTTSYVGLRASVCGNLAAAMLAASNGEPIAVASNGAAVEFTTTGVVEAGAVN